MKKGIIVLLIAVLVSGFAFADFSGSAGVIYNATLSGDKVFDTTNAKSLNFSFTFASESIEVAGDEDVHIEVAASAKFILGSYDDTVKWNNGMALSDGFVSKTKDLADRGIGAVVSLSTAKIVGKDWYVSVLGTQAAYDYAKAAVLTVESKESKDDFGNVSDYEDQAASYVVNSVKAPGVTVGFKGFTASAGFDYVATVDDEKAYIVSATLETPEFAFSDDAVKVQAAAEFERLDIDASAAYLVTNEFGASAKATVAVQDVTVGVTVDMGVENIAVELGGISDKETEFNVDARLDFKYNFVDASIYTYAGKDGLAYGKGADVLGTRIYDSYEDFYLEAKAAFDLNAFELPLKVTVKAKNITNSSTMISSLLDRKAGIEPGIEVEFAKDAIKAAASFEINTELKSWNALVYGTYAFEKFTAGAGLYIEQEDDADEISKVSFAAFAESSKLVNGATFGLGYGLSAGSGDKFYGDGGAAAIAASGQYTTNFKADPVAAGNIAAYCKIAF